MAESKPTASNAVEKSPTLNELTLTSEYTLIQGTSFQDSKEFILNITEDIENLLIAVEADIEQLTLVVADRGEKSLTISLSRWDDLASNQRTRCSHTLPTRIVAGPATIRRLKIRSQDVDEEGRGLPRVFIKDFHLSNKIQIRSVELSRISVHGERGQRLPTITLDHSICTGIDTSRIVVIDNASVRSCRAILLSSKNAVVRIEDITLGRLQLRGCQAFISGNCTANRIVLLQDSSIVLEDRESRADKGVAQKRSGSFRIGRQTPQENGSGVLDGIRIELSAVLQSDTHREWTVFIERKFKNVSLSDLTERRCKAQDRTILVAESGSTINNCRFSRVLFIAHECSAVLQSSGVIEAISCVNAQISGSVISPLYINYTRSYGDCKPEHFRNAILDNVNLSPEAASLPLTLALGDACIVNPVFDSPWTIKSEYIKNNAAGIEAINRIVAKKSTRGATKTSLAYAAAHARRQTASSRSERFLLGFFDWFGFAQRPLVAALWLLIAIVYCVLLANASDWFSSREPAGIGLVLMRAIAATLEPAYFFRIQPNMPSSYMPFSEYGRVVARLLVTSALANWIVAVSRFSRISMK